VSKPRALCAALLVVALSAPLRAAAQQTQQPSAPQPPDAYWPGPWHHMWMWHDGYAWSLWWMFPMMTLFILLAAAALFFVWRVSTPGAHHWPPTGRPWMDPTYSALEILNERFARGEIQKDEYEAKKSAILSGTKR